MSARQRENNNSSFANLSCGNKLDHDRTCHVSATALGEVRVADATQVLYKKRHVPSSPVSSFTVHHIHLSSSNHHHLHTLFTMGHKNFPEDREFSIGLRDTNLVLDVEGGHSEPGTPIIIWTAKNEDNANQKWM